MNPVLPFGPLPADVLILGEAPSREDALRGVPFLGSSGRLLRSLLHQHGYPPDNCFLANVCEFYPEKDDINEWLSDNKKSPEPDWVQIRGKWVHPQVAAGYEKLWQQYLPEIKPKIILALGGVALWALTGLSGIGKWRGSRLSAEGIPCPIIPTWHPAGVMRQMELLPGMKMDLARMKAIHEGRQFPRLYSFKLEPSFTDTIAELSRLAILAERGPLSLSGDIETRWGHIECLGISDSANSAFCIPFLKGWKDRYWSLEEEAEILWHLWGLFRHPNITWIGQNFLYDCQYFFRHWLVLPKQVYDTMIGHHSTFSTMRKGLDFLSSMHAQDHIYWKDEGKNREPGLDDTRFWTYNCKDAAVTFEIAPLIQSAAEQVKSHHDFQQSLFFPVLRMMNRGIRVDKEKRKKLRNELLALAERKQIELDRLVGHPVNPRSSKQLISLFYTDFGLPGIRSMQSEGLTSNSQALSEIALREPILGPICQRISELRSIGVFVSTFIEAKLDIDDRMRCSFAVTGTSSFRFASSENAFGSGANLQNIPIEAKQKISLKGSDKFLLPNIRELFLPDIGYEFFDLDLDRADLHVVVWEADDTDLKVALRSGIDMHCLSACEIFDIKGIPFDELSESHRNYAEHRARIGYAFRQKAKVGVHATDYGVGDTKLAAALGITVREAGRFKSRWFGAHPGIQRWHMRIAQDERRGYTENRFGARLYHLGRFDLPEALAWGPQSTVAGIINRALCNIDAAEQAGVSQIQLLLQVHDSLGGQYPITTREFSLETLRRLSRIPVPYEDELIIPIGIKTSPLSWGACK